MIPYDDLVVALATWRAKQGLPVGQLSAVLTPTASAAPVAPAPSTNSASGPKRSGPPGAPPAPSKAPGSGRTAAPAPVPLPPSAETLDVDEHLVDEDAQLDNVDEFANAFSNIQSDGDEETSIGDAPSPPGTRDSFGGQTANQTDPSPGPARTPNRNDDW